MRSRRRSSAFTRSHLFWTIDRHPCAFWCFRMTPVKCKFGVMRFILLLIASLSLAWPMRGADAPAAPKSDAGGPLVIDIWPGTVPDETDNIGPERVRMSPKLDRKQVEVTEQTKLITAVTKPTIALH